VGSTPSALTNAAWPPGPAEPIDHIAMRRDPLAFVTSLAPEYGDITSHVVAGERMIMLHHPDHVGHVLRDRAAAYTKEGTVDVRMLRPLLGNGLLTSYGQDWAWQRKAYAPAFRPARVTAYDGAVTAATSELLLPRLHAAARDEGTVGMDHLLTSLTLSVLLRVIQGTDIGDVGSGFGRAVDDVNEFMSHMDPMADGVEVAQRRWIAFQKARALLQMVATSLIATRRGRATPEDDLLGRTLIDQHIGSEAELRDQVLTLVMAGHETTAKALTWALYLLDRHPDELARLENEVDSVLQGRTPTAADVSGLARCQRVVEESMRLYPPVWTMTRRATDQDEIAGFGIPAGTFVAFSQWEIHRDPRWHDEPTAFVPDRFEHQRRSAMHPFAYFPFGGGQRICIGQHLALMEATLVLAMIVQRFRVTVAAGAEVEPEALVTLRPVNGLPCTVGER
jgi:enediyne biosynthesis protein E7